MKKRAHASSWNRRYSFTAIEQPYSARPRGAVPMKRQNIAVSTQRAGQRAREKGRGEGGSLGGSGEGRSSPRKFSPFFGMTGARSMSIGNPIWEKKRSRLVGSRSVAMCFLTHCSTVARSCRASEGALLSAVPAPQLREHGPRTRLRCARMHCIGRRMAVASARPHLGLADELLPGSCLGHDTHRNTSLREVAGPGVAHVSTAVRLTARSAQKGRRHRFYPFF